MPNVWLFNSCFQFCEAQGLSAPTLKNYPMTDFFFGRKESESGLVNNQNSMYYFARNEKISREHFKLNFSHAFNLEFEVSPFVNFLNRSGYCLEKGIVKLIGKYLGRGIYLKVKEMGSISGSWLIGYTKLSHKKRFDPKRAKKEKGLFVKKDASLANQSFCLNNSIYINEERLSQTNPLLMNDHLSNRCILNQNFVANQMKNTNLQLIIQKHGSNKLIFSSKKSTRLMRGFTFKGKNEETIQIFQIFKKRSNVLKRERLEHILDLDNYLGFDSQHCISKSATINQQNFSDKKLSNLFSKNRAKAFIQVDQNDSTYQDTQAKDPQFFRKNKTISENEIFENLENISAIMSNEGELDVNNFRNNILPDLLQRKDFNFDLILIRYDPPNDFKPHTNIALLVVNAHFFEFQVKSFPIVFCNETFYLKKNFGIEQCKLSDLCKQLDSYRLDSNTMNLNKNVFEKQVNEHGVDLESEVNKLLENNSISLGFSIRKDLRFIPKSWIIKVNGVGELTFLFNNILVKVSFWSY